MDASGSGAIRPWLIALWLAAALPAPFGESRTLLSVTKPKAHHTKLRDTHPPPVTLQSLLVKALGSARQQQDRVAPQHDRVASRHFISILKHMQQQSAEAMSSSSEHRASPASSAAVATHLGANRPRLRKERFRSVQPLVWFNVPRSGPAFAHTLLFRACPDWPAKDLLRQAQNESLPEFFRSHPLLEHCPADAFVEDSREYRTGGHFGVGGSFFEAHAGHFVGMFRHPLSRFQDVWEHSVGLMQEGDATSSTAQHMAGCLVKTLTSSGQHPCLNHTRVSDQQVQLAVSRIKDFAFVGVVEQWTLSVCLWHAMFGGTIVPQVFIGAPAETLNPGTRTPSIMQWWQDEADAKVYAAAVKRFWSDIEIYGVRASTCQERTKSAREQAAKLAAASDGAHSEQPPVGHELAENSDDMHPMFDAVVVDAVGNIGHQDDETGKQKFDSAPHRHERVVRATEEKSSDPEARELQESESSSAPEVVEVPWSSGDSASKTSEFADKETGPETSEPQESEEVVDPEPSNEQADSSDSQIFAPQQAEEVRHAQTAPSLNVTFSVVDVQQQRHRLKQVLPISWVYVPWTGPRFLNTLVTTVCTNWPQEAVVGPEDFSTINVFLQRWPLTQWCPEGFAQDGDFAEGSHHGVNEPYLEDHASHLVGMFRHPKTRLVWAYTGLHNGEELDKSGQLMTVQDFIDSHAGCFTKTLTRGEKHPCKVGSSDATEEEASRALEALHVFAFIGIYEHWELSVCLWHALYGGEMQRSELRPVDPPQQNSFETSKEFDSWRDPFDDLVYAEATRLFWLKVRQVNLDEDACAQRAEELTSEDYKENLEVNIQEFQAQLNGAELDSVVPWTTPDVTTSLIYDSSGFTVTTTTTTAPPMHLMPSLSSKSSFSEEPKVAYMLNHDVHVYDELVVEAGGWSNTTALTNRSFVIRLWTASGNVALNFVAPGEADRMLLNAMIVPPMNGSARFERSWGDVKTVQIWPWGSPDFGFKVGFNCTPKGWEVRVDGVRAPALDFKHQTTEPVTTVELSSSLQQPCVKLRLANGTTLTAAAMATSSASLSLPNATYRRRELFPSGAGGSAAEGSLTSGAKPARMVMLKTVHNKFVAPHFDGTLRADMAGIDGWQKFTLLERADGRISLRSYGGNYVTASKNGTLTVQAVKPDELTDENLFLLEKKGEDHIALKDHIGRWVVALPNGDLMSEDEGREDWANFFMVESRFVSLRSPDGRYMRADLSGGLSVQTTESKEWERFALLVGPDGRCTLRSYHGKFLFASEDGRASASGNTIEEAGMFELVPLSSGAVTIRSVGGRYLTLGPDNAVLTSRPEAQEEEVFQIVDQEMPENTRFLLYYVPLPSNEKHDTQYYLQSLDWECRLLLQEGRYAEVVGDPDMVREGVPGCMPATPLAFPKLNFEDLRFGEEVGRMSSNCTVKFAQSYVHITHFRDMARVWLNKVPLLCAKAERHPDEVTVMLDAGLKSKNGSVWYSALGASRDLAPGRLGMPRYTQEFGNRSWFGQDGCVTAPVANAMFLAVRGRDCPNIMQGYELAMKQQIEETRCPCFDEEILLTRMLSDMPHLIDTRWTAGTGTPVYR